MPTLGETLYATGGDRFAVVLADMTVADARRLVEAADCTHVVVVRVDPDSQVYHYLFTRWFVLEQFSRADPRSDLREPLGLHEFTSVETIPEDADANAGPARAVVLGEAGVVGFVDRQWIEPGFVFEPGEVVRGAEDVNDKGRGGGYGGYGGAVFEGTQPARVLSDVGESSVAFIAYPLLKVPQRVSHGERFSVVVGFRDDLDPLLQSTGQLQFARPNTGEQCRIELSARGARVRDGHGRLALRPNDRWTFDCEVEPGVDEVRLLVRYRFRGQLIGRARRRVVVGDAHIEGSPVYVTALGVPVADGLVDLTVTVTRPDPDASVLEWTIGGPTFAEGIEARSDLAEADARQLAADLIRDQRDAGTGGPAAWRSLEYYAQRIAACVPPEFFKALRDVYRSVGRVLSLQLHADEAFVPWELALVDPPLDPAVPPFLAAQTVMGRWIEADGVMLPPAMGVKARRVSAVAATEYQDRTGLRTLPEAVAERERLVQNWRAIGLEATRLGVQPLLGAAVPGHLLHVATHGLSNPAANDQVLMLADGWSLRPSFLVGRYRLGDTPALEFVFLNACQVGVPGISLGQAAGFPGAFVLGGARGFVAPFWEVDDAQAHTLALDFYSHTLPTDGKPGEPVGEVLRRARAACADGGPIGPLAYVYYGHPSLRLRLKTD